MVGGITSVISGGKFGHGFVAAGLSPGVTGSIGALTRVQSVALGAVLGGTASRISGGKFANGAAFGAFAAAVRGATLRHKSNNHYDSSQQRTLDGKPAAGKKSFGEESLKKIKALLNTAKSELVGKRFATVPDAAVALSNNDSLVTISETYKIEFGSIISKTGEITHIKTSYHHSLINFYSLSLGDSVWHTYPGPVTARVNGQLKSLKGFSGADQFLAEDHRSSVFVLHSDRDLWQHNTLSKTQSKYRSDSKNWLVTGRW